MLLVGAALATAGFAGRGEPDRAAKQGSHAHQAESQEEAEEYEEAREAPHSGHSY